MDDGTNERLKRFLLPGAASVVGVGAGLVLTKTDKLKGALPSLNGTGIGDLAEDLRSKIGSVAGTSGSGPEQSTASSRSRRKLDSNELAKRQRERQQRRKQRAGR